MKDLFLQVFEISLSTSAVVLVLLLLSTLLNRRYAAKWKYGIWILLALRLAIPMQVSLPKKQVVVLDIPTRIAAPIVIDRGQVVAVSPTMQATVPSTTPLDVIAVLWLVGAALFLAVHLIAYWRYKRKVMKSCTRVTDLSILQQVRSIAKELGLRDRIPVIQDPNAGSPMVLGFFHPVLVLPEMKYQSRELYFVLKHELVHMKRHDVFAKLLFVAANAVHWFNPLMYLMQKEAVVDMELSCDERVVKGTVYEARKAYTETLLSTMCRQYKKSTALTTEFYGGKEIMKKRFRNILNRARKRNGVIFLVLVITTALILGMVTGCSGPTAEAPNASNPAVAENAHSRGIINSSTLNIRKEPSVSSENVGVLREGEEVEILETQGDWGRIDRGWIYLYYVDMDAASQEATVNPEEIVKTSGLNIRKEPSVSAENVGVLRQGEAVEILETQGDWGRIDRGWIYLKYVDMDSGNQKATVNTDRKEMLNAAGVATQFAMARFRNDMDAMWQYLTPDWEGIFFDITFDKFPVQSELQVQGMERPGDISLSSKDPVSIYSNPVPVGSTTTMVMEVKDVYDSDNFIVCLIRQEDGWKVYDFGFEKSHDFDRKEEPNVYETGVSGDDAEAYETTQPASDMQQLAVTATEFADAYFGKKAEHVKEFLTDPSVYTGVDNSPEKRWVNAIKGIDTFDTREVAEGEVVAVSIEYRDYEYPDSFNYITTEFVMQNGQWKVQSYIGEK